MDALRNETIGAQSLDTDTHGDAEVQVLQNTLQSGLAGNENVVHEPRVSGSRPLQGGRINTLVQAELMTDLWKSPLTTT